MCEKGKSPKEIESELKSGIKRDTYLAWILVGVGALLAVIGVVGVCSISGGKETTALSRLDSYSSFLQGAVGSIWTLAGFVLIYVAFLGQKLQLLQQEVQIQEQKQQFANEKKDQEQEIAEQRKQFVLQHESIKRQNFEHTFFQLLNLQQQIVTSLREKRANDIERDPFAYLYSRLHDKFFNGDTAEHLDRLKESLTGDTKQRLASMAKFYLNFYKQSQSELGHYFRNLYHIFKFVDQAEALRSDDKSMELRNKRQYTSPSSDN